MQSTFQFREKIRKAQAEDRPYLNIEWWDKTAPLWNKTDHPNPFLPPRPTGPTPFLKLGLAPMNGMRPYPKDRDQLNREHRVSHFVDRGTFKQRLLDGARYGLAGGITAIYVRTYFKPWPKHSVLPMIGYYVVPYVFAGMGFVATREFTSTFFENPRSHVPLLLGALYSGSLFAFVYKSPSYFFFTTIALSAITMLENSMSYNGLTFYPQSNPDAIVTENTLIFKDRRLRPGDRLYDILGFNFGNYKERNELPPTYEKFLKEEEK